MPTATKRRTTEKTVTPEERYRMIAEAAYLLAEKNGFAGDNVAFWLSAEKEVDAALSKPTRKRAAKKIAAEA